MHRSGENRLAAFEAAYREALLSALATCAQGRWGLFGRNDAALVKSPHLKARLRPPEVDELLELGAQIAALRERLGYIEPFALHNRLVRMRSSHHANSPGEPTLASQWLAELNTEDAAI